MKLDFRIDWGYQYLYSRRHYHPVYIWDGELSCDGGKIEKIFKLDYPVIWYGPGQSAKETLLDEPKWQSRTKRGLAGIRVEADTDAGAVFTLNTVSGSFTFTAADIAEKGRIEFPVGPEYLSCFVTVTLTDYLWFRPEPKANEQIFDYDKLDLPVHDWSRMKLAWLSPGESVSIEVDIPESSADYSETVFHTIAMGAPDYSAEKESQVEGEMSFSLLCDGENILDFKRYYRYHDFCIQMLEDDLKCVRIPSGRHTLTLVNRHDSFSLAISRIIVKQSEYSHGQISVPEWALSGEIVIGKVFAARNDALTIFAGDKKINCDCTCGWNEFAFTACGEGNMSISCGNFEAQTEVYDCGTEKYPVKVGYDLTAIPHDRNGYMDWLLDYTQRTKLGNYIMFRSFNGAPEEDAMYAWGKFCKDHGMYVSACRNYLDGSLARGAGEMFNDCGQHEYPGLIYAADPREPYCSDDMKTASEKFMAFLKEDIDKSHTVCDTAAFGDASGGIRYSFLAGADFVRAETMVPHTMSLLSQARAAAESLGEGRWGAHIAIQHCYQPYRETHMGQYFLSLMQPWMMGAEVIYEEDSLFNMWSEERQAWDDALVKGKRDMTRSFFKYVSTHPRRGKCRRNIAFLEGRYAAPFNGFICDVEQDPHYSVWGAFGNDSAEWGHAQPEKCRQILDVLMKGASTHPFRQKFEKRRFYFSGTPFGDFDCVPAEASADYFENYKLMLNLGWNTMIDEDYEKLLKFVKDGGVLLTGIPQFSTHTKRDFLKDMNDLALYRGGDLSELCGLRVNGRGTEYSGQWNSPLKNVVCEPELSAMPSDDTNEDGTAYLCDVTLDGAEIVAWDAATGDPMLVRYKLGRGFVYTLTLHAYPGHEKFQKFSAAWTEYLSRQAMGDVYVKDPTETVFWTVWEDEDGVGKTLMMLNTDWTEKGNEKQAEIVTPAGSMMISVKEREALICKVTDKIELSRVTL